MNPTPRHSPPDPLANGSVTEVRILPDGTLMVNNLTPEAAEWLAVLQPTEPDFNLRRRPNTRTN